VLDLTTVAEKKHRWRFPAEINSGPVLKASLMRISIENWVRSVVFNLADLGVENCAISF
jgi:hypothetical protein